MHTHLHKEELVKEELKSSLDLGNDTQLEKKLNQLMTRLGDKGKDTITRLGNKRDNIIY